MARRRTATLTAANQFTGNISLKRGGIVTLSGTFTGNVSLQRYDDTSAAWVDVTSNAGTPVVYTVIGTYGVDPYGFAAQYRVGYKAGATPTGSCVASIEGK